MPLLRNEVMRVGTRLAFATIAALGVVCMRETLRDPQSAQALDIMPRTSITSTVYPGNTAPTVATTTDNANDLHNWLMNTYAEGALEAAALVVGSIGFVATRRPITE